MRHTDDSSEWPPLTERGDHVVAPDGRRVEGWIEHDEPCPSCGVPRVYAVLFDAFLCMRCNRWLEEACDDPDCDYCHRRPPTPLP